ncbi:MAG: ankyrin repeat domain-containing protein [Armatimonadota bacterium]
MVSNTARSARHAAVAALVLTAATTALLPALPVHAAAPFLVAVRDGEGDSAVLRAVAEGSAEKLAAALGAGVDINGTDKNGKTALMLAASLGRTDLVQTLLEKGAPVNQIDNEGRTALHYVLAGSNPEPQKKKSGFGGFMDKAKGIGGKALSVVASAGPLANFLPGGALLQNLAQGMMGQGLSSLMTPGASFGLGNANAWSGVLGSALMNGANKNGAAPVLGAVDGLLQNGANSAAMASSWGTLLSSAGSRQPDLIKAMSNLGDDATPGERAAWSTFLATAQSGDTVALEAMVTDPALAPVLARATDGLRAAAMQIPGRDGGEGIVQALLAKGADTTIADKSGLTALGRAQSAKLDVVTRLLEQPASILKAAR